MEYDSGDGFSLNFERNRIPFSSKSKRKTVITIIFLSIQKEIKSIFWSVIFYWWDWLKKLKYSST